MGHLTLQPFEIITGRAYLVKHSSLFLEPFLVTNTAGRHRNTTRHYGTINFYFNEKIKFCFETLLKMSKSRKVANETAKLWSKKNLFKLYQNFW